MNKWKKPLRREPIKPLPAVVKKRTNSMMSSNKGVAGYRSMVTKTVGIIKE